MSEPKDFDTFWLLKGQKLASNTFTNLGKRLSNYTTYLNYLSGFYTATGVALTAFSEWQSLFTYAVIIAPIIVLYLTHYVIATDQTIPLNLVDLRSPLQINHTYRDLVEQLKKEVETAKKWVSLATLCVIVGGTAAAYLIRGENQANAAAKVNIDLENEYTKNRKLHFEISNDKLTVEAKLTEAKWFKITYMLEGTEKAYILYIPSLTDYKRELPIEKLIDINPINNE